MSNKLKSYHYIVLFIYLVLLYSSCLINSNIGYQKDLINSNQSRYNSRFADSTNTILSNAVDLSDYLNVEDNANNNFFISMFNQHNGIYVECQSLKIDKDSISLKVISKDITKNNSFEFILRIDRNDISLQSLKKSGTGYDALFQINEKSNSGPKNRFVEDKLHIRKFNGFRMKNDLSHLYTGEITSSDGRFSQFIIINDVTKMDPIMDTVWYLFSFQFDHRKIELDCYEKLKKKCTNGTVIAIPYVVDDVLIGAQFICRGGCETNK